MEQGKEKEPVSKLPLDNPSDFRFHAAYVAYSETWDGNDSEEVRNSLNQLISSLHAGKSSYEDFYGSLSQFRRQAVFRPERIQSMRKSEYRRSQMREARNARHKK